MKTPREKYGDKNHLSHLSAVELCRNSAETWKGEIFWRPLGSLAVHGKAQE